MQALVFLTLHIAHVKALRLVKDASNITAARMAKCMPGAHVYPHVPGMIHPNVEGQRS